MLCKVIDPQRAAPLDLARRDVSIAHDQVLLFGTESEKAGFEVAEEHSLLKDDVQLQL